MPEIITGQPKLAHPMSKRQTNKLDKFRRIQEAAEELFVTRGYDSATMRDIAARAGVALGTLFVYATNKRDLLFLIANDIMESAVDEAISLVDAGKSLTHNMTLIAGIHFQAFWTKPELFRLILRELVFYDSGVQGLRAVKNRSRLLNLIQDLVTSAVASGQVKSEADPELITRVIFSIIQAEIRSWVAQEHREMSVGLKSVWGSIALLLNGIAIQPTALSASATNLRDVFSKLSAMEMQPTAATSANS